MAFTTIPWHLMGMRVAGDCNGETIYTDRYRRKVHYKKAPPDRPPSPKQLARRDLFRRAVQAWKALPQGDKDQLEFAATCANLCLTGQNLFTSCSLRSSEEVYRTIERQTATTLPPLAILQ